MRTLAFALALGVGVAMAAPVENVAGLVNQLGSANYRERTAAFRELDALGESALEALRTAIGSADSETARRALELVRRIEYRANSARILKPSLVEIDIVDKPIPEAVKEFNAKTNLALATVGDTSALGKRTVTYQSGRVPLWEAVSGFTKAAKLSEWDGLTPIPGLPAPITTAQIEVAKPIMVGQNGQMIFRNGVRGTNQNQMPRLGLLDRLPIPTPTHQAGAVRIRVLPSSTPLPATSADPAEYLLPLQVSLEPRLSWSGAPKVKDAQATNERGEALGLSLVDTVRVTASEEEMLVINNLMGAGNFALPVPNQRSQIVCLRLRRGDQSAQALKELSGVLSLPLKEFGEIVAIGDPLKSVGQVARANNAALTLHSIERGDNGEFKVDVSFDVPLDVNAPGIFPGARVAFNGVMVQRQVGRLEAPVERNNFLGLALVDAQGKSYLVSGISNQQVAFNFPAQNTRVAITFRAPTGAGEPAKLSYSGLMPATIEAPFQFRDVPLP